MDLQQDLEVKTEQTVKETARAGKKMFVFAVKAEAELLKGAFNIAAFIPKHIINGLAEKSEEVYRGKQTLEQLTGSGAKLENIPIDKDKTKIFESIARKYSIDYSLKKTVEGNKSQCLVFFKAKDMSVLNAAFKEYTAKVIDNERKKSISERVKKDRTAEKSQNRERTREKKKTREEVL